MPDLLTIEHDPDSGCAGCAVVARQDYKCRVNGIRLEPQNMHDARSGWGWGAPDECPLRTGRVVVQRPASAEGDVSDG